MFGALMWSSFILLQKGVVVREQRKRFRVEGNAHATIYYCNSPFVRECVVSNFSGDGAKITGVETGPLPDEFILRISPHSPARRCHVVWRSKDGLGVEFADKPGAPINSTQSDFAF
jgi:hypothetical protein